MRDFDFAWFLLRTNGGLARHGWRP